MRTPPLADALRDRLTAAGFLARDVPLPPGVDARRDFVTPRTRRVEEIVRTLRSVLTGELGFDQSGDGVHLRRRVLRFERGAHHAIFVVTAGRRVLVTHRWDAAGVGHRRRPLEPCRAPSPGAPLARLPARPAPLREDGTAGDLAR